MGRFRIVVTAIGNHGCQREMKDGETVSGCGQPSCPDCAVRAFVKTLQDQNQSIESATLEHWPGTPEQVTDDLLTGVRAGSF